MLRYTARSVLPVDAPPVRDGGAVLVRDGRIVAAGRSRDVPGSGARTVDLGDAVLMPGPVNAHTHLELSWMGDDPPLGTDWTSWVEDLVARRIAERPERAVEAARREVAGLTRRGTVAVGDVANGTVGLEALIRSDLHAVVFREVFRLRDADVDDALAALDADLADIRRRLEREGADRRIRIAPSPHAPHTTAPRLVRSLVERARSANTPLSVHAAESDAEVRWLRDGGGPLASFYARRGLVDIGWEPPGISPIATLDRSGAIGPDTLVVHAVHLEPEDVETIRVRGATVVTCPRSNRRLGVGRTPVERLLRAGVPVALGTDSRASTPDLDPFAELAALRAEHPGLDPSAALRIATLEGARALGLTGSFGSLAPGRHAVLVAVEPEAPGDDPVETVTTGPRAVRRLPEQGS